MFDPCCVCPWSCRVYIKKQKKFPPDTDEESVTEGSTASTAQGKPSLRRIKGRIHRSKSLDSLDLLDSNVGVTIQLSVGVYVCVCASAEGNSSHSPGHLRNT